MILHLIEQLVHLEYRRQGLDEYGGLDGTAGQTEFVLGPGEHLAPPASFQMALQLGYVEVGTGALGQQRLVVVQEIEGEVEQAAGNGGTIKGDVLLRQMQTAHPADEHGRVGIQGIGLPLRALVGNGAVDRIAQVDLALDHLVPGRGQGVLEVGHEDLDVGVEGIDHHFALDRAGDLHTAVLQIGGDAAHRPVTIANMGGLWQEVRQLAAIDTGLACDSLLQQLIALGSETFHQFGHQGHRIRRQDLRVIGKHLALNAQAGAADGLGRCRHSGYSSKSYILNLLTTTNVYIPFFQTPRNSGVTRFIRCKRMADSST